jgi:hypothetical protein
MTYEIEIQLKKVFSPYSPYLCAPEALKTMEFTTQVTANTKGDAVRSILGKSLYFEDSGVTIFPAQWWGKGDDMQLALRKHSFFYVAKAHVYVKEVS